MRTIEEDVIATAAEWMMRKRIDDKLPRRFGCLGALLIATFVALAFLGMAALAYNWWRAT
jgi:hypothetical protein